MDVSILRISKYSLELTSGRFQERLLSSRNLLFTQTGVSFECPRTRFDEDVVYEHPDFTYENHELHGDSIKTPFETFTDSADDPYDSYPYPVYHKYMTLVCAYSSRSVTYQDDILNAFAGISRVLSADLETSFSMAIL